MPRIRTIKPEFMQDEELSALPPATHLLAAGLICYADDYGYFNANPGLVRGCVMPLRGEAQNIGDMMQALEKIGYLRLGTLEGKRYGHIVGFDRHQRVSHPTPSKIGCLPIKWEGVPELVQSSPEVSGEIPEESRKPPETFRPEGKGKEGNGWEGSAPPPGLHELNYAPKVLQEIGMPEIRGNIELVGAAIKARARGQPSAYPAAMQYIIARALDDRDQGIQIDGFWFRDGKYERKTAAKKSIYDAIDRPV